MAKVLDCPSGANLKEFALGRMVGPQGEAILEHIEACPSCAAALQPFLAEDTIADALQGKETLDNKEDQEVLQKLLARVRALPKQAQQAEETMDTVDQPEAWGAHQAKDSMTGDTQGPADPGDEEDDALAPPQAPDEIGRLGPYRVLKVLGEGGMGKVYLAEDPGLKRKVALKVMKSSLARNAKARQRFLLEARSAAAIEHDHIVHIYQVGEDKGIPYLAMQLLTGASLDDLLKKKGALTIKQVLKLGAQIGEGLAAAHAKGLIHRDIKPGNIWIEAVQGGRVKILDFGLARSVQSDVGLTQSGAIIGTPAFMPPEQARGDRNLDHRCDLYSLGCVLYRMATGELPIKGNDTMGMLMALALNTPTTPLSIKADLPSALSDLIMQLLAKEPEQRPASAKEVVKALKTIERALNSPAPGDTVSLAVRSGANSGVSAAEKTNPSASPRRIDSAPEPVRPPVPPKNRRLAAVAAALGAAAVLLAGIVFFFSIGDSTIRVEVNDKDIKVAVDGGELKIVGSDKKEYTVSPGEHGLRIRQGDMEFATDKFNLKKGETVALKIEWFAGVLTVQRDGKALAVTTLPGKESPPIVLVPGKPIELRKPSWVPDRSVPPLPGIIPSPALIKGIEKWQVMSTAATGPSAISPDWRWVAVSGPHFLQIYEAGSGKLVRLGPKAGTGVEFSTDSKWILSRNRGEINFSGTGGGLEFISLEGNPGPKFPVSMYARAYGWNPKHPIWAFMPHDMPDRIHLANPNKEVVEIVADQRMEGTAVWSPDGESLLVVRADKSAQIFDRHGKPGAALQGRVDIPFLPGAGTTRYEAAPVWSPDASAIFALSNPLEPRVWTREGKVVATLAKHDKTVRRLWWRPDGKMLATAEEEGKLRFWTPDGTPAGVVEWGTGPIQGLDLVWGSDGKSFSTLVAGTARCWPAVDRPFTEVKRALALSPDGANLLTFDTRARPEDLNSISMTAVQEGKVAEVGWRLPTLFFDWSGAQFDPNGRRLFLFDWVGPRVVDVRDSKKVVAMGGRSPGDLAQCALSPRGDRLAVGTVPGRIYVCDAAGQPLPAAWQPLRLGEDPNGGDLWNPGQFAQGKIVWHPDGRHLLVSVLNRIQVFDTQEGQRVAATEVHGQNGGRSAIFNPGNPAQIVYTGMATGLWNWQTERRAPQPMELFLGPLLPSPDGKQLLCRNPGKWPQGSHGPPQIVSPDLKHRTPLPQEELQGEGYYATEFAWLPDGKHFLAGTQPLTIRSLDGKVVETIKPVDGLDTANPKILLLSPDGKTIVGQTPHHIFALNLADKKLTSLMGIRGDSPQFSPDGKLLITVEKSTILYWNLATKELEQIVLLLPDDQYVLFSPAGEILARSTNAEHYYRYLVEDKGGKVELKTPEEFGK